MKSDVITVSAKRNCTDAVLTQAEKVAVYQGLSHKGALRLRLLAEEMTNLMRAITGDVEGLFWIENEGESFELHLRANTTVDFLKRERLLALSSSGRNEATRSLTGLLRSFFEPVEGVPMSIEPCSDAIGADMVWSMRFYQEQIARAVEQNRTGAAEAWDELEKSVVTHAADEVKVSVRSGEAELIVFKKLA